jgi:glutamate/tyrosine decarboxylase-like PLP-dependent enzyme
MGNGFPFAALADYLASVVNPNMAGGDHIGNYVERQVIDWFKQIVGFPAGASGILVSGGSMANLLGLAVARNVKAGWDVRAEGLVGTAHKLTVYSSSETHSSNYKAVELLGIGKDWMRFIPVNAKNQIDLAALEQAIAADRAAGHAPLCVIGNAATTNTGAFDDLDRLADICEREGLWFHVDGAFGALAALSDELKPLVAGLERADSLAFDLHKLMYMPFEVAGVLIRNFEDHVNTFSASPDYLSHMPRGLAGGQHAWFADLGLQLTRSFRALKVWMSVRAYGLDHFTSQIEQNVEQARYLVSLIQASPDLELLADAPFNIVCFRFNNHQMDEQALNDCNQEILMRLHERGLAAPSYTRIHGQFALRVSITNHRTTRADLDFLIEQVIALAHEF